MPHSTRRKRPGSSSNKLVNIDTEDGWSVVGRKGDLKRNSEITNVLHKASLHDRFRHVPPEQLLERLTLDQAAPLRDRLNRQEPEPKAAQISVEKLNGYYADISKAWLASTARKWMKSTLDLQIRNRRLKNIDRAICLGLGSLSADFNPQGRRSAWQLAVFLDMAGLLVNEEKDEPRTNLYAQDPVFNDVDCKMLTSLNVHILKDPAAFDLINERALVFAPHYPVAAWSEQMRRGCMGLMLGNDVASALPNLPHQHELEQYWDRETGHDTKGPVPDLNANRQLQQFLDSHESIAFMEPEEAPHALNALRCYWRRDLETDDHESTGSHSIVSP